MAIRSSVSVLRNVCLLLVLLLPAGAVHAQGVIMASPSYQAQQRTQLQPHDDQPPVDSVVPVADPSAPCSSDLDCQQKLLALALITQQYTQDTDTLASQSLAVQRVGFDALLGILFVAIVLGLTVPNLLRRSNG